MAVNASIAGRVEVMAAAIGAGADLNLTKCKTLAPAAVLLSTALDGTPAVRSSEAAGGEVIAAGGCAGRLWTDVNLAVKRTSRDSISPADQGRV